MSARLPIDPVLREQFFSDYVDLQRRLNRAVMELEAIQADCFQRDWPEMEQHVRKSLEELRSTV